MTAGEKCRRKCQAAFPLSVFPFLSWHILAAGRIFGNSGLLPVSLSFEVIDEKGHSFPPGRRREGGSSPRNERVGRVRLAGIST
jgi:hypothetical protein